MTTDRQALRAVALRMLAAYRDENELARAFGAEICRNAVLRSQLIRFALPLILAGDEIDGEEATIGVPNGSAKRDVPTPSTRIDERGQQYPAAYAAKGGAPLSSTPSGGGGQTSGVAYSDHLVRATPPDTHRDGKATHRAPCQEAKPGAPSRPVPKGPSAGLVEAMMRSKIQSATRVMFTLHDGRNIMTVEMRELPAYRKSGAKQAVICDRILKHASNADPYWRVNRVITNETLEKFVREFDREMVNV